LKVALKLINENEPGSKWSAVFDRTWPFYKKWYLKEGATRRPGYLTCSEKLEAFMPELVPIYEKLCDLAGGGDLVSRYLSLYKPPPFMSGCTQVAVNDGEPVLIRNYDYDPKLFEGILLSTNWLKPVIGMSDCNWGLLDGMNADGLCLSLTFGGRRSVGEGFGIPLVMRYVLETCSNVEEAIEAFGRVPVHMVYNVTVQDRSGKHRTLFLGPDREMGISEQAVCTNHQEQIDWPEYAEVTSTLEREEKLERHLAKGFSTKKLIKRFMREPLYELQPERHYATLYTAAYFPEKGLVRILWPGREIGVSFEEFNEKQMVVDLGKHMKGEFTA